MCLQAGPAGVTHAACTTRFLTLTRGDAQSIHATTRSPPGGLLSLLPGKGTAGSLAQRQQACVRARAVHGLSRLPALSPRAPHLQPVGPVRHAHGLGLLLGRAAPQEIPRRPHLAAPRHERRVCRQVRPAERTRCVASAPTTAAGVACILWKPGSRLTQGPSVLWWRVSARLESLTAQCPDSAVPDRGRRRRPPVCR